MSDFWEMVIPALTVSFIFMTVFGFAGFMRYMRYKETIALAERGLLRPERGRSKRTGRNNLKIGVLLLVVGGAFACSLMTIGLVSEAGEPAVIGVIFGILPASFGLGLVIVDRINQGDTAARSESDMEIEIEEDDIPPHKV